MENSKNTNTNISSELVNKSKSLEVYLSEGGRNNEQLEAFANELLPLIGAALVANSFTEWDRYMEKERAKHGPLFGASPYYGPSGTSISNEAIGQ